MFTDKDLKQLKEKGIDISTVEKQLENFKKGFPYINLVAPATIGNGITVFDDEEIKKYENYYKKHYSEHEILKFVPASGAASRMFKHLYEFRQNYKKTPEDIEAYEADKSFNSAYNFFTNIKKFAFYNDLKSVLAKNGYNIEELLAEKDFNVILDYFLTEKGLGYSKLPKGLLLFHNYPDEPRTAMEEHLVEAAQYAVNKKNVATVHFTVSPEHQEKFQNKVKEKKGKYEKFYNVILDVTYSQQKPSTDTIAMDMNNKPFRNEDGTILFRPGGHGALIENLNDLEGDIIFIKNIDNVVPDRLKKTTIQYKKVIGGLLLNLQNKTFEYLDDLDDGNISSKQLNEIEIFAKKHLNIFIPDAYYGYEKIEKIDFLFNKLNRPVRVCGMVKNEGEPGGGPFWVKNENDEISLQIIESSQIDFSKPDQKEIVNKATHFNPVDLVCGVRDFNGEPFDLREFVDPQTGFISQKSKDGKDLKALELPGLWNGAMADWNTIFVEVPLITFNPVKTVNDLLREQHQ